MPSREPRAHGASDLMLVFGVATVALGVVMVSRGLLPYPPAAHLVPPTRAALGRVERLMPASDELPVTTMPPADRVAATPETRTVSSSATRVVTACPALLDLDHDLRLVLLAMARQRRRTLHPTARVVPPDKQHVPARDRALARAQEAVAPAEASPPVVELPRGPVC